MKEIRLHIQIFMMMSLVTSLNVFAQNFEKDTLKCNIKVILEISEQVETISDLQMERLLKAYGKECSNNVEFSEFSNEILFKTIQKQPELFCNIFEKIKSEIELEVILLELETPIHDLINMKFTRRQIEKTRISDDIKNLLLNSIDKAINN